MRANPLWHERLAARFARSIPDVAERIGFLPWMQRERFKQTLAAVNCVLDSLHFGGGTTCRQMLNLGKPYVTLPGAFVRGRFGYANLSAIGVTDHDWRRDIEARLQSAVEASREQSFRRTDYQLDFFRRAVAAAPEKITV